MSPLARRVLRRLGADALVGPGDRLAVALSGGADSVALLWLIRELEGAGRLRGSIAGAIHINHQLRGAESSRDEAFCRSLAERLGWPIDVTVVDVAARARDARRSVETTAREVRYQCFLEAARRLGATRVATAHTLDDQAETVLLRLLRGTSSRGLGGIRVSRGMFIRPVLTCRRAELRGYLHARGEPYCEDSSNQDLRVPRNRVRHRLLPIIEEIAPGGIAALARFAWLAADDESYLERVANEAAIEVEAGRPDVESDGRRHPFRSEPSGVQVNVKALAALPGPVGRRVLRQAIEELSPHIGLTTAHLLAAWKLATARRSSGHLDLPGVQLELGPERLCIETRRARTRAPAAAVSGWGSARIGRASAAWSQEADDAPIRPAVLDVPGSVDISEAGISISAVEARSVAAAELAGSGPEVAMIQASAVALPLHVRTRRPGDRFRPFGAPGRRKLQDLFVDRKLPRQERDRVPIVVDAKGRIVWVVGLAIAEECRVTAPGTGVVVLKAERKVST